MSCYREPMIYKLDRAPPIIEKVLLEMGWIAFDESIHEPNQWNLCWKAQR